MQGNDTATNAAIEFGSHSVASLLCRRMCVCVCVCVCEFGFVCCCFKGEEKQKYLVVTVSLTDGECHFVRKWSGYAELRKMQSLRNLGLEKHRWNERTLACRNIRLREHIPPALFGDQEAAPKSPAYPHLNF